MQTPTDGQAVAARRNAAMTISDGKFISFPVVVHRIEQSIWRFG
jgi:hypothetical protein